MTINGSIGLRWMDGRLTTAVKRMNLTNQDRLRLRGLLLAGAESSSTSPTDATYFEGLRARVRTDAATRR